MDSRALDNLPSVGPKKIEGIILDSKREPVHEFLAALTDSELEEFYSAFEMILEAPGWEQIGNWFKPLRNHSNVWQVTVRKYRVLGFRHGETLIFTNEFKKQGKKTPQEEINRSLRIQQEFKAARRWE